MTASFRIATATEDEDSSVEFHGPSAHPGYPDAFQIGYTLRKSGLSPNKQYGVIFPNRLLEDNPDFIVNLRNARVLGMLETDEPYFEGKGHSGFSVNWSPDSTAVLVEIGGRWWPQDLVLIEMKGGKIFRQTGLLDQLGKMFSPALPKSERTGVSEFDITEVTWKTGRGLQLQITCEGSTNPKGSPQLSTWEGKLVAVWDVAQQKFSQQKVTQTSFTPAEKEE